MNFTEYQIESRRTRANDLSGPMECAIAVLGLSGEAGEVVDLMKKHLGHGHQLNRVKVAEEAGDLLFYLAWVADLIDYDLEAIAVLNMKKLRERYPTGFDSERSMHR